MAETTCAVDACATTGVLRRGMCEKHYKSWRRRQSVLPPVPSRRNSCTVGGCDDDVWGRCYCRKHYERWKRTGQTGLLPVPPLHQRLDERIDYDGPIPEHMPDAGPCWLWMGHRRRYDYGVISVKRRTLLVHRVVYEQIVGPIPDGLTLDHLCRNPPCCNPDHMEPVTNAENSRRMRRWVLERRSDAGHGSDASPHAEAAG